MNEEQMHQMHQMVLFAVALSRMATAARDQKPVELTAEEVVAVVAAIQLLNQKSRGVS